MTSGVKYQQTIQRMRKSIRRLDEELERSRMLTHDITIDNKTDKNLDLIIKVQDDFDQFQFSKSESRVSVPQFSTYRHRISTSRQRSTDKTQTQIIKNKSIQKSQAGQKKDFQTSKQVRSELIELRNYQATQRDKNSPVKYQRKFKPFSHVSMKNEQNRHLRQRQKLYQNGVQTEMSFSVPFSHFSETKQQEDISQQKIPIQQKIHSFILKTPGSKVQMQKNQEKHLQSTAQRLQSERTEQVTLPVSVFQHESNTTDKKQPNRNNLPFQEQNNKKDLLDYEAMNISFSKLQQSTKLKLQKKEKSEWKVESLSIGYQNNKKYFEKSNQKQQFIKAKHSERQNRLNLGKYQSNRSNSKVTSSSKEKNQSYLSKFQINKNTDQTKKKANDLFLQRKALLLHNLQKSKQVKNHQNRFLARPSAKTQYISQFNSENTKLNQKKRSQISPKALQVSQRLYSRSKLKLKPCDHYQRYSESIERQRFEQLVRQNSFVSQKMTKEEKESVFQSLRRCEDSVSTWPMKLVNYTYSKLEKIKVYSKSKSKTLV